jgi:hypothetical protein
VVLSPPVETAGYPQGPLRGRILFGLRGNSALALLTFAEDNDIRNVAITLPSALVSRPGESFFTPCCFFLLCRCGEDPGTIEITIIS